MVRRLAAILAADVVGFSRLMERDETGTLAALKAHREDLIDPLVARYRGRTVKLMGDGALIEFPSVVDAVECAHAVQSAMAERKAAASEATRIEFRIGINLGDVIVEGDDIYGDGVNVASRLEGLAEPGGVCLSGSVYEQVRHKLDLAFDDLGEQKVKNILQSVHVYRIAEGGAPEEPAGEPSVSEAPTPPSDRPSIAVLPFDNMSGDAEQDYLADGISEDLITALSKIRSFLIIARNSTFTYKGRAVEVKQVARELGVRYVLEGSVRKAARRVRITAQLIDAATGLHVWAERYDREFTDIFDLQDEMTQTIVAAVEPELSAAERDRALSKSTENLGAWENYQRGIWHMWTWEEEHNPIAIELLRRATTQDPNFAPAYAYESYAHYQSVILGWDPDTAARLAQGMAAAKKALIADDKDAMAYFAQGRIQMMLGQLDDSVASLEKATAFNPSLSQAYHGLGMSWTLSGRLEEAKTMQAKAVRLSPRDPMLWAFTAVHALAYILSEDYEEALIWAQKTVQIPKSTGYWPPAVLAGALAGLGRMDEARAAVAEAVEALPELSVSYLKKILPTKHPDGLKPWLDGLGQAGLPE